MQGDNVRGDSNVISLNFGDDRGKASTSKQNKIIDLRKLSNQTNIDEILNGKNGDPQRKSKSRGKSTKKSSKVTKQSANQINLGSLLNQPSEADLKGDFSIPMDLN